MAVILEDGYDVITLMMCRPMYVKFIRWDKIQNTIW